MVWDEHALLCSVVRLFSSVTFRMEGMRNFGPLWMTAIIIAITII